MGQNKGLKCEVWGWLREKCALSSNSWECLWQAFQEGDQYNSYHVSHIDHWLGIVIRVPDGKTMLLVLRRETERGTQRGWRGNKYKVGVIIWNKFILSRLKCMKGGSDYTIDVLQISHLLCIRPFQSQWIFVRLILITKFKNHLFNAQ